MARKARGKTATKRTARQGATGTASGTAVRKGATRAAAGAATPKGAAGTATGTAKKAGRWKVTAEARAQAAALARKMPFVHYPARVKLSEWKYWGAFKSRTQRGELPRGSEPFTVLEDAHAFAYAGPCCFIDSHKHHGDTVAYLAPEVDSRLPGEASPFDSGALEKGWLQPWSNSSMDERWDLLRQYTYPFAQWRERFEEWLRHCYAQPERYLECAQDRHAAGEPDRTLPPEVLRHNGTRGLKLYGPGQCSDRRAWTWEARFAAPVPFEEIRLLHVPARELQTALEAVRDRLLGATPPTRVLPLPANAVNSPEALYLHSREALEEFLK
jgi:hypothetical protein